MVHPADPMTSDSTTAPAISTAAATIPLDQHAFDTDLPEPSQVRKVALWVLLLLIASGVIVLAVFFAGVRHWVALHTGIINGGPDKYYNFWSGFGSDLGEVTLISAVGIGVYTGVRKVNCHTKGCWRIGHHSLDGTPYVLCRHHHPHVPSRGATHEHILEQQRRHQEQQGIR